MNEIGARLDLLLPLGLLGSLFFLPRAILIALRLARLLRGLLRRGLWRVGSDPGSVPHQVVPPSRDGSWVQ